MSDPPTETTVPGATAPDPLRVGKHDAALLDLPSPDWLAADERHVYVKLDGGSVERLDPATGEVLASAHIEGERGVSGSGCQGIGVGFDSVWSCYGADVVRFGLDPFEEVSRIPAGKTASQGHLAAGFGRLWILQGDGSALVGIDPDTEAVGDPIPLPLRGTDLAVGGDAVWIVSKLDDAVIAIDPVDGAVLHRYDVSGASMVSIDEKAVWIGGTNEVHRVEPTTGELVSTIAGPGGALAADGSGVWVRTGNDVRHIDAASGAVTDRFTLSLSERSPGDMLYAFGALWTSGSEDAVLFRITLN